MTEAELTDYGNRGASIRPAEVRALVAECRYRGAVVEQVVRERDSALTSERRLAAELDRLKIENERLKRGEFTPEEFQHLCHNRDERPGCTREEFLAGCADYQRKLFGELKSDSNGN